ncbi:MAG: PEP-CTERM sorting domain-containing protein [Phycisphaeraceae bacterium]|nr:PEP-CTERM sorting domain-containing protein [Phycisphaeraceae bacterium]
MTKQLLAIAAATALSTQVLATPIFDTFGPLPEATFAGTGIPNDEVAIGSQLFDGTTITAALTATRRFGNPDVTSDGAGNFTATPGSNFGDAGQSSFEGALWNFGYFIKVEGGGRTIEDLQFDLYYDFDPGEDTNIAGLGLIDLTTAAPLVGPGLTKLESSQNLMFGFLENPTSPADTFVTPPPGAFDPNALGEYNFAIVVSDPNTNFAVEIVAIDVQVVPEPTSLALLGLGGFALMGRRRSN